MLDVYSDDAQSDADSPAGNVRGTRAGLRVRVPPLLAAAMAGEGTRSSRCRLLRALPHAFGIRHRELVLMALARAAGERDREIRIAALDGLYALACDVPRLRERIAGLLSRASLMPSRSTAMHAAVLHASLTEDLPGIDGGHG